MNTGLGYTKTIYKSVQWQNVEAENLFIFCVWLSEVLSC